MKRVYIAGPLSGNQGTNIHNAIKFMEAIAEAGFTPFCPHLFHFWHLAYPHEYEFWMKHDLEWLATCDAVFRMPGASLGADREVARARELDIPVFFGMESLIFWSNK
jgi:hypothetical protein